MQKFTEECAEIGDSRAKAVVVGGDTLAKVLQAEGKNAVLIDEFIKLTDEATSVLCCRVSPKQKAEVVRLVQARKEGCTTLSIGDGANDVNMITAANIGVGISGLEGQQAARAADYSIGQFRFLKVLLFVHGRECYRRNAYLVLYFFYKNLLLVLPIWYYGFLSLFSGVQLYNTWLYQSYNLFFTALPIGYFSIFDWQKTKAELLSHPELYAIGLNNEKFSTFVFWESYIVAILQGGILTFLSFETLDGAAGVSIHYDYEKRELAYGPTYGSLSLNGLFVFQAVVVVANVKIMIASSTHSVVSVGLQVGSIVFFFLAYWLLGLPALAQPDLLGTFRMMMTLMSNWMLIFFFALSYCLFEYCLKLMYDNLNNVYQYQKMLEDQRERKRLALLFENRAEKKTVYRHRGFDFDGEEGHDELVVGNLLSKLKAGLQRSVFAHLHDG